jgi:TusA-related sulfurtransferase
MKDKADYLLDFRGQSVLLSLLKISELVRQMKSQELLEVTVGDPWVHSDVLKIAPQCELVGLETNHEECFCRMQLEKK